MTSERRRRQDPQIQTETFSMDPGEVQIGLGPLSLPTEIWTMILERVEQKNDLLACRQVNRQLHSITTPVCRRRFIRLNLAKMLGNPEYNLETFYSTFKNGDNLPWSACELDVDTFNDDEDTSRFPMSLLQIREFLRLFGSHIHELTILGEKLFENEGLLSTMDGVPNIEYLDTSRMSISRRIHESFPTQLSKLKGLIASIDDYEDFRFFEMLLNRPEVQLRSLHLIICSDHWGAMDSGREVRVLPTLIAGIPILRLEMAGLAPELMYTEFTRKGIQVGQLDVHLCGSPYVAHASSYSSLEGFLKNTAGSLLKLTLHDSQGDAKRGLPELTIPIFPHLTYLGINPGVPMGSRLLPNLSPFTPDQFPSLAKVNVRINSRFWRVTLFGPGPFDTVTELVLSDMDLLRRNPLQADWDKIFPNLKKLDADVTDSGLELILTKFQRLERLFLTVWCHQYPHAGDVSRILSGGRQFGSEALEQKYASQEGESATASMLLLTRLKEFELQVYPRQQTMCDAFVDSCLLRIQPLDNLCLKNVVISDEYKKKLQKYHRKVEIHDEYSYRYRNDAPSFDGLR